VNLERTNIGELNPKLVPETVDVITVDLSYLPIAEAIPQLEPSRIADDADLVALVKPMFEPELPRLPEAPTEVRRAVRQAVGAIESGPWRVLRQAPSPVRGAHGAREWMLHARRWRVT
jgi:predicted rRNA methylase YqxC with S4 and FtsJ domains